MQVVLLEDMKALGKKGQIVSMNDGYIRSFVLPEEFGVEVNPKNLNDLKSKEASGDRIATEQLAAIKELGTKLDEPSVTLTIEAGGGGRAFGSISSKKIDKATGDQLGTDIGKRKIVLNGPVESIDSFEAPIELHKEVTARLVIKVVEA